MLPTLNLNPRKHDRPPLLFGAAPVVIGVHGRSPSVLGQGQIRTAGELKQAVAQAQNQAPRDDSGAMIALISTVNPGFFQALTIHVSNGQLRLYDTNYNSNTLHLITHKPLVTNVDLVYTWEGVLDISRTWFEILLEE